MNYKEMEKRMLKSEIIVEKIILFESLVSYYLIHNTESEYIKWVEEIRDKDKELNDYIIYKRLILLQYMDENNFKETMA